MDKRFNIHDWQAKQRQQRLTENDDAYQKRQDAMTPGKNPDYFYDDEYKKLKQKYSGAQGSMDNADIQSLQNLVQKYSLDKILVTLGITGDRALPIQLKKPSQGEDMNENIDDDVERKINNFIKNMADDLKIPLQYVVYNIIRVIKSQNYDGVNEHHGDDFPKDLLDKKVSSFLDDLKKKTKEGPDYEAVEDIMKKHFNIDETNSLGSSGGGTIFTSGNGMAHLGKKKKNK